MLTAFDKKMIVELLLSRRLGEWGADIFAYAVCGQIVIYGSPLDTREGEICLTCVEMRLDKIIKRLNLIQRPSAIVRRSL